MYARYFSTEKQIETRESLARQSGVNYLDLMHDQASKGLGLDKMLQLYPSADRDRLRCWLETNEYKV